MAASPSVESRLRGALWGLCAGDALAMPTHWYYGSEAQVRRDYGSSLTGYVRPKERLPGSIMSKSNTDGGGRGGFHAGRATIIGDYMNHGKKKYWAPGQDYHYHATLQRGENTLEAQLVRVLMRSLVATRGVLDAAHFREAYVDFLRTPGSHNDTYASTCHRMFLANLVHGKKKPEDCPDNDGHNVDTIDGLVLPQVAAAAAAVATKGDAAAAQRAARDCARVTRDSRALEKAAAVWADLVGATLQGADLQRSLAAAAAALGFGARPLVGRADDVVS